MIVFAVCSADLVAFTYSTQDVSELASVLGDSDSSPWLQLSIRTHERSHVSAEERIQDAGRNVNKVQIRKSMYPSKPRLLNRYGPCPSCRSGDLTEPYGGTKPQIAFLGPTV